MQCPKCGAEVKKTEYYDPENFETIVVIKCLNYECYHQFSYKKEDGE